MGCGGSKAANVEPTEEAKPKDEDPLAPRKSKGGKKKGGGSSKRKSRRGASQRRSKRERKADQSVAEKIRDVLQAQLAGHGGLQPVKRLQSTVSVLHCAATARILILA